VGREGSARRIAVIGMGSLLMQDDGVGIHALRALEDAGAADEAVALVDGGTDAWSALWAARGARHLVLLDAVRGGGEPGRVYRFALDEAKVAQDWTSLHDVSVADLVRLRTGEDEEFESVIVIGMEPARIEPGTELSAVCREALPAMVQAARDEIEGLKHIDTVPGAQPC